MSLFALADGVYLIWSLSLALGMVGKAVSDVDNRPVVDKLWRAGARIHQELWIVIPPIVVIRCVDHWHSSPVMIVFDAFALYVWWGTKDWPDENRWKRRGKRAKDAVSVQFGRLVVVPA